MALKLSILILRGEAPGSEWLKMAKSNDGKSFFRKGKILLRLIIQEFDNQLSIARKTVQMVQLKLKIYKFFSPKLNILTNF